SLHHQQVVVFLQPSPHPVLPLAASPTFGSGWNAPDPEGGPSAPRWAQGDATLAYYNPYPHPIAATLSMNVVGEGGRSLSVSLNGNGVFARTIGSRAEPIRLERLMLKPGVNRMDLATDQPAVRISEERSRLRAFGISALKFQTDPRPAQ